MYLNSDQIEAFYQVAKVLSYSKAAKNLGLSQPALSIRIRKLEETLKTSLFLRESAGIQLTDSGHKLYLHCQLRGDIEKELLSELKVETGFRAPLSGLIRIAGFSTVVKSVLIPSLNEFIFKNSGVQIEVITLELHELKNSLKKSEAEFVITEGPLVDGHIESILVGYENNVIVESKNILDSRTHIYLDNDPEDQATFNFFKAQNKKVPTFDRWYLDDAHSIIEAVEQGWGRAVHPLHIVQNYSRLRTVPGYKIINAPVYLNFYKQPFYSQIQSAIREHLIKEMNKRLPKKS